MEQEQNLSVGRNIKIGFFHLGSGMADVLTTGIWNRIMISDLGFAATPIGLLVSLRYFLAPLGVWAGKMSDQKNVFGFKRLFWVWLGRALMVLSMFLLGWQTGAIAGGQAVTAGVWIILSVALLMFSLGNALSGSTFLALIYDRASEAQRGRAVGIVWTFLLLGFTVGGIVFGVLLPEHPATPVSIMVLAESNYFESGPEFTPDRITNLFLIAGVILGSLWFFSLLGEERRTRTDAGVVTPNEDEPSLMEDLRLVVKNTSMRFFALYLTLSMIFAFSQDLILEPFAADVFDMSPSVTTRFAAYWGSMSILGSLLFLGLSRRYRFLTNSTMSIAGVVLLMITFVMLSISSYAGMVSLVMPSLLVLGLGLGFWNIGTLGLMMDMSPYGRAGTFLGFWTLLVTFARGFGVSGGGIARDIALNVTGDTHFAYGFVFTVGIFGLAAALYALNQIETSAPDNPDHELHAVFAGALD